MVHDQREHRQDMHIVRFWRLARFGFVGLFCALVFGVCSRVLIDLSGLPVYAAAGLSYILVTPLSYGLHRGFTFRTKVSHSTSLPKYLTVSVISTAIAAFLPAAMNSKSGLEMDINYALSLTCVIVPLVTYLLKSTWVFAGNDKAHN